MTRIPALVVAAALAAPALAQSPRNTEPRTARPIPHQGGTKTAAEPVATTPAKSRGEVASTSVTPTKPFEAARRVSPADPARFERLHFAAEPDGAIWVRGRAYKARFGAGGATYIPFFGSSAPRNFPVGLSLATASVGGVPIDLAPAECAVRDGDRVVIDRGPIDEVYELALDHVEQTFVVAERPAAGDLELFVSLSSELARAQTNDGIELSNELGSVRYGRAFVREADGRKVPVASRLVEGGVEIRVDASYLETAQFPLVVDPFITSFHINSTTANDFDADVSYDVSTNRYLAVFTEVFSATDFDVFAQLRSGAGVEIQSGYVDFSGEHWIGPQCGNLNSADQFLCAAQVGNVPGTSGWVIRGRTIQAANLVFGTKFDISTPDQSGDKILADVAGDPFVVANSAFYCVVWQRNFSAADTDIHARLVRPDSTLVGTFTTRIDDSSGTIDSSPSISKSNGQLGGNAAWTVVWHRLLSASNYDVRFARLSWDGLFLTESTPITTSAAAEYLPRVSSPLEDGHVLVTWAVNEGTDHDIHYALLQGGTVETTGNLSAMDSLFVLGRNQVEHSVDADDARFAVTFAEPRFDTGQDGDTWVSAFVPFGGALECVEPRVPLGTGSFDDLRPDIVSTWSGGGAAHRFFAAWDVVDWPATTHNVLGALYDAPNNGHVSFCYGDGSNGSCPCGDQTDFPRGCANSAFSSGAGLWVTGVAAPGAGDTLAIEAFSMLPNVACTLFQGTAAVPGAAFGDGVRCVGGSLIRIRTKNADASGSATWPEAGDPSISVAGLVPAAGAVRMYQATYRNSVSFCTPATFNVTSGVRVLWQP